MDTFFEALNALTSALGFKARKAKLEFNAIGVDLEFTAWPKLKRQSLVWERVGWARDPSDNGRKNDKL